MNNNLELTNLELKYIKREGVSSKTGKPYCFYELYTIVNGIPIKVVPLVGDNTGKTLIKNYLDRLNQKGEKNVRFC